MRGISEDEYRRLVGEIPDTVNGRRNRTMFETMYSAGLRTHEACELLPVDFDPTSPSLSVRKGKGDKPRWVPIEDDLAARIEAWLGEDDRPRGPKVPLLPVMSGKGRGNAINPRQVRKTIERLAIRAKVFRTVREDGTEGPISPHMLRHSYAHRMLLNGMPISMIKRLLGHSSVTTTQRYLQVGDEVLGDMTRRALRGEHVSLQKQAELEAVADRRLAGGVADDAGSTMERLMREEMARRSPAELAAAIAFLDREGAGSDDV